MAYGSGNRAFVSRRDGSGRGIFLRDGLPTGTGMGMVRHIRKKMQLLEVEKFA